MAIDRRCLRSLSTLLVGLVVGCATPGSATLEVRAPLSFDTASAKLAVSVEEPSYGMDPALRAELLGAIVAALRQTRKFSRVFASETTSDGPADLDLKVKIVSAREVSNTLRGNVGIFAGRGSFSADVVVLTRTAQLVGSARIAASTGDGSWAGTNSEAVDIFTERVVAFMLGAR